MDHRSPEKPDLSRRGFIRLASLTAGSAGAFAAGVKTELVEAEPASAQVSAGYHESEHIKTYYARARM